MHSRRFQLLEPHRLRLRGPGSGRRRDRRHDPFRTVHLSLRHPAVGRKRAGSGRRHRLSMSRSRLRPRGRTGIRNPRGELVDLRNRPRRLGGRLRGVPRAREPARVLRRAAGASRRDRRDGRGRGSGRRLSRRQPGERGLDLPRDVAPAGAGVPARPRHRHPRDRVGPGRCLGLVRRRDPLPDLPGPAGVRGPASRRLLHAPERRLRRVRSLPRTARRRHGAVRHRLSRNALVHASPRSRLQPRRRRERRRSRRRSRWRHRRPRLLQLFMRNSPRC